MKLNQLLRARCRGSGARSRQDREFHERRPCSRRLAHLAGRALMIVLVGLTPLTGVTTALDIVWNGTNGTWNLAANWTPADVPNAAGEVAILPIVATPYTTDLNVSIGLDEVRLEDPASTLRLGGQIMTLLQPSGLSNAGTIRANNGTSVISGNIVNHAGAQIVVEQSRTLNLAGPSVVNDGTIWVNNTGALEAFLSFADSVTVSGTGGIYINGNDSSDRLYGAEGVVVTQEAGHTLHGCGDVEVELINHGTVQADKSSGTLWLSANPKMNDGILRATSGGILQVYGITITNAGGTILADGSEVQLTNGANIVGGTLDRTGTSQIVGTGAATLTDVTIAPGARYTVNQNYTTTIAGSSLVNDGTIWVNHTGGHDASLCFADSVTASGTGDIYINGDNDSDRLYGATGVVVTQEAGHTIHGAGGLEAELINHGAIQADKSSKNLTLWSNPKTNDGMLRATGGGILRIWGITLSNEGGTVLADGGEVQLTDGANIIGGTLDRTGTSQIACTGAATLTDVTIAPGARYTVNQNYTTTIAGSSLVNDGTLWVNHTGGFDAALYFADSVTVSGTGDIYVNGDNDSDKLYGAEGVVVTQEAGHTIHGAGGVEVELINHGTIQADKNLKNLTLWSNPKTNDGMLRTANGGILRIWGITLNNEGGIVRADSGEVQLSQGANIIGGTLDRTGTSQIACTGAATLTDVAIAPGARYTVNQNYTTTIAGSTLANDGTIWVNHTGGYDAALYFSGSTTVSGAGDIYINGNDTGDRLYGATGVVVTQAAGHTLHGGGSIQTQFLNRGTVRADKASVNLTASAQGFNNQGIAEASGGAELRFSVLPVNYASRELIGGTWRAFENSRIRFNGAYIDSSNAAIVLHGPGSVIYANYQTTDALAGFVNNEEQGSFNLEAGRMFTTSGHFHNSGTVAVLDSCALTVGGGNNYSQTGGVTCVDGHFSATAIDLAAGWLAGSGTVTGDVSSTAGWVAPGASVGTLTIEGDYAQGGLGRLRVEIGGTGPGESDLLVVSGQVDLDGYLSVVTLPDLALEAGDSIRILDCASLQGEFVHLSGICPLPGICLDVVYDATGVTLVARELEPSSVDQDETQEPQPEITSVPPAIGLFAQQGLDVGSLLRLDLPDPSAVRVELFDVAGRRAAVLLNGHLAAGSHTFACGGRSSGHSDLGSGVYFARARVQSVGESVTKTVRLVILK
jgi:hypothetical protein